MTGIAFSPLVPVWLIVILAIVAVGLIAYGIWHKARGALLRAIPVAALVLAIADPELVSETHSPLKDVAVVVVDDSDSQKLGARRDQAEKALEKLTTELSATADLEVRTVRAGHVDANGHQDGTRLFAAVTSAMSDIPAKRLAGTILITDGQVHDALAPDRAAQVHAPYLNAPLHMMVTGQRDEYDRRIRVESAPDFGIVGQQVTIKLRVEDTAAPVGTTVPIAIRRNGGPAQEAMLATGRTAEVPVSIDNPGSNVFEVEVMAGKDELSTENNRTMVAINGIRDRLKVLLVSGQPHVGERSWRNLLKSDPNVDLIHFTILRPTTKDDGTPLNELALIGFPVRELFEEKLKQFDLIIFDRYNQRGVVPSEYMARVAKYVQEGGAVMLAVGPEYSDTYSLFGGPLQGILPAEPTGRVYPGTFRPHLSDVGHRHPVTASLEGGTTKTDAAAGEEPAWGRWLRQIQVSKPGQRATVDPEPRRQRPRGPIAVRHHLAVGKRFRRRRSASRVDAPCRPLADERTGAGRRSLGGGGARRRAVDYAPKPVGRRSAGIGQAAHRRRANRHPKRCRRRQVRGQDADHRARSLSLERRQEHRARGRGLAQSAGSL
jgi:hypothetical protein